MNSPRTCYVSMVFGKKSDAESGRTVDYDEVYRELIVPPVQRAGFECLRADNLTGGLIHKDIAKAVIAADVMIADVSGGNANVMYELGLRHALRRGGTVLVTSTLLPFNIYTSYALRYDVESVRGPNADTFREQLASVLADQARGTDSPIFEYFPELEVVLPPDLRSPEARRRSYPPEAQRVRGRDRKAAVARAEQATRSATNVDPQAYLDVLNRYFNLSAWDDVVRVADELPDEVAQLPQVVQAKALAYSRLGQTERAIEVLSRHIERTGGHPESRSLLGSLYKKQHFADGSTRALYAAIDQYREAFKLNPEDLYLGRNLAQLLHRLGSFDARADLQQLLPQLRRLVTAELADPVHDFWMLNSALVLSLLDGDAKMADAITSEMLTLSPEPWMLDAARSELSGVLERAVNDSQRNLLQSTIDRLSPTQVADAEELDDAQL